MTEQQELPEDAIGWKERGNAFFKAKHYPEAIESYTKAIELDPSIPSFYTNRAFAYIRSEGFGAALEDANKALEIDPKFVKAYYRRASANMGLAKWKASKRDFEAVLKVVPNDKDAQRKLKECDKIIRQIAFEKAIAVDSSSSQKNIIDIIKEKLQSMTVPDSYNGPRLNDDGSVSLQFLEEMMEYFRQGKVIHKKYALQIIQTVYNQVRHQLSLTDISIAEGGKITVCGDVHGQYYDLCHIFKINGLPSTENPYVFNGDFVDRGSFGVEVILTLFGFKALYPDHLHLSRGNHETDNMNKVYGFEGEVKAKYDAEVMDYFSAVFNWLPLGHVIHNKVLVVHGGLPSKSGIKLDEMRHIDRNKQPPEDGPMCDMLWADPHELSGFAPSKRGVGKQFGPDVTERFLERNDLTLLIRSHEVKQEGYEIAHNGKCITVFSAPNYCDQMGNKAAFITLREDCNPDITQFDAVPHPDVKPMAYASNFMNLLGM